MHTHSLRLVPLLIGLKERPERPSSLRERTKLLGEGGKDTQINRKEERNRIEKKAGQAEEKPKGGGGETSDSRAETDSTVLLCGTKLPTAPHTRWSMFLSHFSHLNKHLLGTFNNSTEY